MGTLFPNDPEYPDYRPLPRLVNGRQVAAVGMLGALGCGLVIGSYEPMSRGDEHVPHQDVVETLRPAYSYAVSTSTGDHHFTAKRL